jgi:hypothetical protein
VWGGVIFAGLLLGVFVLGEMITTNRLMTLLFISAFVIPMVATLISFGLLSLVIAFLANQALNNAPLTLDLSMPYASGALWSLLLVVGLAVFGFYASRGGQPLLGRLAEGD